MNKKVALCLHGLVGNLEKYGKGAVIPYKLVYDSYIQNLYDKSIEIDVFIHSWSIDLEDEIKLLYNPKSSIFEPFGHQKWANMRQSSGPQKIQ